MKIRFASSAAALSVFGFMAWVSLGSRSDPGPAGMQGPSSSLEAAPSDDAPTLQEQTVGSAVACAVPLAWRIARVDEPFGLSHEEAAAAFHQAAALWEEAVGRGLFSNEADGELPVRFVYDDRQERTQERSRLLTAFNATSEVLEARKVGLQERSQRYRDMRSQYQEASQELDQRVTDLNELIRYWNARGSAPADVLPDLEATGRGLATEREALTARAREIEGLERRLAEDSEGLNREVESHRREGEALEAAFPVTRTQSGTYREAMHTQDGAAASVTREIRIYRFDGQDDLVRVAAHELGHALGLGHSAVPGVLMREEFDETTLSEGPPRVQAGDVEALRSLCPGL